MSFSVIEETIKNLKVLFLYNFLHLVINLVGYLLLCIALCKVDFDGYSSYGTDIVYALKDIPRTAAMVLVSL